VNTDIFNALIFNEPEESNENTDAASHNEA
jgi:hypothetical protein